MNKVILMGRLTKEPEVRYTQTSNTLVCSFLLYENPQIVWGFSKALAVS